jgi:hypothetical protein
MNEQINQMEQDTENKPSELSKLRGTDHEGFRRMIQRAVRRMEWRMKHRQSTSLFAKKTEQ